MSKTSNRGIAWTPRGNVQFSPVPFVLIRAIARYKEPDSEYVPDPRTKVWEDEPDYGVYAGEYFDPWHKGDLIALSVQTSVWTLGKGHSTYRRWFIARRANAPSVEANKRHDQSTRLYRIPYRYLQRASELVGQEFETREAVEAALSAASQSLSIAAE